MASAFSYRPISLPYNLLKMAGSGDRWLKKLAKHEVAIFRQKLQLSERILTANFEFLT